MQYKATFELTRNCLADLVADLEIVDTFLASRREGRKRDGKDVVRFAEQIAKSAA